METQTTTSTPKKKRVRKRSLAIQLQEALNCAQSVDKEPTNDLTIARMKFLQARLAVLAKMQARERNDKLKRALAENERLNAENEGLRQDLQQALAAKATARPLSEAELVLARYEASKNGNPTGGTAS